MATLLLLAATSDLYGLIAQSIARRRYEIGIRLALGATSGQTIRRIVRSAILLVHCGVASRRGSGHVPLRGPGAFPAQHGLWGVRATDPVTFLTTAGILLAVAALAALAPALTYIKDGSRSDAAK